MVTIKDVAKHAGVSHGTVSNILKGMRGVSLEKVQRVEKAVKELGYQPAAAARSLKTNKTMNVGVVLPNITDPCYSRMFTGIERVLSSNQYSTSLFITSEVAANEKTILRQIQQQRMDGLIIATCQPGNISLFEELAKGGMKIVFMEREVGGKDYNFIGFNNKLSIHDVTHRLLGMGYKTISLVTGPEDYYSERQCIEGYNEALLEQGIPLNSHLLEITNMDRESSFKAALRLLQLGEVPEAIISSSMQIAEGISKAIGICKDNLIKKPLVLSLSEDSWTNSAVSGMVKIPRKPISLGEKAAELLLENINNSAFFDSKSLLVENAITEMELCSESCSVNIRSESKDSIRVLMLDSSSAYATYSLMADFRRKEGITVHIDTLSYLELFEAIQDGKTSSQYDVFQVDIPWLPEFAEKGLLYDLSGSINENPLSIQDLIPGILDSYARYDDSIYALPYMYGTQLLFYRKDLFENNKYQRRFYEQYHTDLKPPKTWTEYNAVARFFTRAFNPDSPTLYGTTLGGKNSSGAVCEFIPRKWAYGGRSFNADGSVALNSKEAIKALNNYCESFKYASPTSTEHWWDEQVKEFCNGDAAMMVLFMSHATDITDRYKSKVVGKVGFDLVPGGAPLLGGWSLGINSNSSKLASAFKFISWSCCKEMAIPHTILGGSTPCVNLYNSSELLSVYPWMPKSLESFSISRKRTVPKSRNGIVISERKYEEILGDAVYSSITNRLQPEEALKVAADKLQALILQKKSN